MDSGVVLRFASESFAVSSSLPFRSVRRKEICSAEIATASKQPRSALKRIISGGRPPLDSPSPSGSIRSFNKRSFTTFVTVGALSPEARTRSALEHEPHSRKRFRMPCAFVWRNTEGLPIGIDFFFTLSGRHQPQRLLYADDTVQSSRKHE